MLLLSFLLFPIALLGQPAEEAEKRKLKASLTYECADGVHISALRESQERLIAAFCKYPRWSWDGKSIACIRRNEIIVVDTASGEGRAVAQVENPRTLSYAAYQKIFFSDGLELKVYDLEKKTVAVAYSGKRFLEIDVSFDAKYLVGTAKELFGNVIYVLDLNAKTLRKIARGCSASFSPDIKLITRNVGGHAKMFLLSFSDGKEIGSIAPPPNEKFDNQFWSNHPDWITSIDENKNGRSIWIHQVSKNKAYKIEGTLNCDRPDLFVW